MDTRFWGPSGWQLCHLVAHSYSGKHTSAFKSFFENLQDILPCKFCRESTTKFVGEKPPDMENIAKWVYNLHNKVNHKLRSQCKEDPKVICPPPDPHFEAVSNIYKALLAQPPTSPPGLDFLFCVAYNYKSNPNRQAYSALYKSLKLIYPFEKLRVLITEPNFSDVFGWWYQISRKMCAVTGCEVGTIRGTLQKYGRYKSGCTRGKTCRNGKKIRDHRHTYKVTHDRLLRITK